ncbi:non-functional pseudokinase ZED1-like [Pistacia vera]|uniref:non-functional pseudokinase ZED1-like n=1 Tax=Pistacia vera TaxID=55513 RepID=UPI0012637B6F|nr:non-functional pseudokinase ZED1-like [Pistacia vera]
MTTKEGRVNILKNGETLLRELITLFNGKRNPIRNFSAKELKTATSNYDMGNVIIIDDSYRLYKGFRKDGPISVMKYEDNTSIEQANKESINCIVFASQMGHKNILKLIGCCLETQTPILVFEYVQHYTYANLIYRPLEPQFKPLPLTHRLKIAMEVANAVAYLHFGFSRPIVSRTYKPGYIVFNDQHVAKMFDFSWSVSIPEGETHIEIAVQGLLEYIAPEYLKKGILNEKTDVYGFGCFLIELLTGNGISNILQAEPDYDLILEKIMKKCIEDGYNKMVDPTILGEEPYSGKDLQLQAATQLAVKCVSESAEERPTMIDAAKQLRQMYRLS